MYVTELRILIGDLQYSCGQTVIQLIERGNCTARNYCYLIVFAENYTLHTFGNGASFSGTKRHAEFNNRVKLR